MVLEWPVAMAGLWLGPSPCCAGVTTAQRLGRVLLKVARVREERLRYPKRGDRGVVGCWDVAGGTAVSPGAGASAG